MWDEEIRHMASSHAIMASGVFMATVVPAVLVPGFSVYGTHLLWQYSVAGVVAVTLSPTTSLSSLSRAHSLSLTETVCLYCMSTGRQSLLLCHKLHNVDALCVCKMCICILVICFRAMSVWDTSLQMVVGCSVVGAWLGAFPIPLDWDRPWQVWPVSCSLGGVIGYLTGLVVAPAWIHWHRKHLTYKSK
uniref:Phosphatidylinositol-glycan biosynthesis class F protein n=1 Tax=Oncorhynchus tshawytscha TaxID=74940 RepID=A0AAZ3QME0_ONCTS